MTRPEAVRGICRHREVVAAFLRGDRGVVETAGVVGAPLVAYLIETRWGGVNSRIDPKVIHEGLNVGV